MDSYTSCTLMQEKYTVSQGIRVFYHCQGMTLGGESGGSIMPGTDHRQWVLRCLLPAWNLPPAGLHHPLRYTVSPTAGSDLFPLGWVLASLVGNGLGPWTLWQLASGRARSLLCLALWELPLPECSSSLRSSLPSGLLYSVGAIGGSGGM